MVESPKAMPMRASAGTRAASWNLSLSSHSAWIRGSIPVPVVAGTTAPTSVAATIATPAATGIGMRGNDQPRRIGFSITTYDAIATTRVTPMRSTVSGNRSRPVRCPSRTRKIGQWTR
jgi:hypothetical protein